MKRILMVFALLSIGLAGVSEAATVRLTADPNTEADWAGDKLYRAPGTCGSPGPFAAVLTVPPTTGGATVQFMDSNVPNGTFCYYVTAFDFARNESVPSNLVQVTVDAQAPAPPANLRQVPSAELESAEDVPQP